MPGVWHEDTHVLPTCCTQRLGTSSLQKCRAMRDPLRRAQRQHTVYRGASPHTPQPLGPPVAWLYSQYGRQTTRHGRGTLRGHKKDPLAGAAGEEASLCVVFQRNVSTAMPDLDSGVGTGLGDRVVFLDRVAYCPLQYALRSPTMNRVEMESSLSSSCSEKNACLRCLLRVSNQGPNRAELIIRSCSPRSHRRTCGRHHSTLVVIHSFFCDSRSLYRLHDHV